MKTSQLAMPQTVCEKTYARGGYSGSARNLSRISLATDNVFSDDGALHQLATVTGNVRDRFVANLTIGV